MLLLPFKTLARFAVFGPYSSLSPVKRSRMAGLSVLLEAQNSLPKYAHIISKTSLPKNSPSSSFSNSPFLERCCFCRRKLHQGNDIYMYRGDRAFCSVECRCRQIFMDEESGPRDHCSLAAAAAAAAEAGPRAERSRPGRVARKGRAIAGDDFAY